MEIKFEQSREGGTPFTRLLHFTLDPYLIMLSIKQGSTKYDFFSLWYDWILEWTLVSRAIGEHFTYYANEPDSWL